MSRHLAPKFLFNSQEFKLRPEYDGKAKRRASRRMAIQAINQLCRMPSFNLVEFVAHPDLERKTAKAEILELHLRRNFLTSDFRIDRLRVEAWAKEAQTELQATFLSTTEASSSFTSFTTERLEQESNLSAHQSSHQAESYTDGTVTASHVTTSERIADTESDQQSEEICMSCLSCNCQGDCVDAFTLYTAAYPAPSLRLGQESNLSTHQLKLSTKYASILSCSGYAKGYLHKHIMDKGWNRELAKSSYAIHISQYSQLAIAGVDHGEVALALSGLFVAITIWLVFIQECLSGPQGVALAHA